MCSRLIYTWKDYIQGKGYYIHLGTYKEKFAQVIKYNRQ